MCFVNCVCGCVKVSLGRASDSRVSRTVRKEQFSMESTSGSASNPGALPLSGVPPAAAVAASDMDTIQSHTSQSRYIDYRILIIIINVYYYHEA